MKQIVQTTSLIQLGLLAVLFVPVVFAQSSQSKVLRVGIVGDQFGSTGTPDPYQVLAQGLSLLKQKNVSMLLHVGDLIEGTGQPSPEYNARFSRAATVLDQIKIPWYLTPGDHDVNPADFTSNSGDHSVEKQFFENYSVRRPGLNPGLYYSFDVNNYHFIALNSLEHLRTDIRWGDAFLAALSADQFAWLQKDLATHRSSAGIVVFMHQPLWYNVAAWQPVHRLLRQYPVRAVIAGHMHYSQDEGSVDGIRYFIVGATGASVKQASPDAGNAQVVTVMTLHGKDLDLELLPVGSDSPRTFPSRLDMDRIQALDQALDDLSGWQWEPANALCLRNGAVVMTVDGSPAVIRLRAIGNPIDIPVRFELHVEAIGLPPTQGTFATGICQQSPGDACVIAPGATTTISNTSTVEFRWPNSTETPVDQKVPALPPLWQAPLPTTGLTITPGTALHIHAKYSFPADGASKYVERDIQTTVNSCTDTHP